MQARKYLGFERVVGRRCNESNPEIICFVISLAFLDSLESWR